MSNGGGDGSDGDNKCREDRFGVPCNFFEPFLISYSFEDELKIKNDGGVILAEVNEGDNVLFLLEEAAEVDSGSGERSRVESQHCEMRRLVSKKAWLA